MSDDHARYAEWDAAYVLGALSLAERREYESHLESCERCRAAVAELSGLPGLLGRLDDARAFSLLEDESSPLPVPPTADIADAVESIERARRRRRVRRLRMVVGLAAAAVIAGAVAVPLTIAAQPHPAVAVALKPAEKSPLTAEVELTSVAWGTKIDMRCAYGTRNTWQNPSAEGDWSYGLWVIDRKGHATQVSSWKATGGSQVRLTAATALSVGQIATVQVRSIATGDVLLSKDL
jgi:anti-sigma factor RsiW